MLRNFFNVKHKWVPFCAVSSLNFARTYPCLQFFACFRIPNFIFPCKCAFKYTHTFSIFRDFSTRFELHYTGCYNERMLETRTFLVHIGYGIVNFHWTFRIFFNQRIQSHRYVWFCLFTKRKVRPKFQTVTDWLLWKLTAVYLKYESYDRLKYA